VTRLTSNDSLAGSFSAANSVGMAKRTYVMLVNDLTGEELKDGNGGTISFGKASNIAIDLGDKNADRLRGASAECIAVATRVGWKTRTPGTRSVAGPSARETSPSAEQLVTSN
jgi:hypothetical protein